MGAFGKHKQQTNPRKRIKMSNPMATSSCKLIDLCTHNDHVITLMYI